jgi:hypothetical protein
MKQCYLSVVLLAFSVVCCAQGTVNTNGSYKNAISTAVPFLTIGPDARSGAMGEAGVALSPDANSAYWNPAKLAFVDEPSSVTLSYSPWMRSITPDVNLAYLSFFKKLDDRNTLGASLRYFNMGTVNSYDFNAVSLGQLKPNEYSLDISLARKFGDGFSLGLTGRYIHSNLTQGGAVEGVQTNASNAVAADVSLYYTKAKNNGTLSYGVDISNIGTKMQYSENGPQYFLPTNLKLGVARTLNIDEFSQFTFAFDINKLLVPTPPIRDANGNITAGTDNNRSVVSGIFGSFTDAPGGFSEELKEINFSPGVEYSFNKTFFMRAGYFYENPDKGNRQYTTLGAGVHYSNIIFDFSYLATDANKSPLANVLRFSLGYSFGAGPLKK